MHNQSRADNKYIIMHIHTHITWSLVVVHIQKRGSNKELYQLTTETHYMLVNTGIASLVVHTGLLWFRECVRT